MGQHKDKKSKRGGRRVPELTLQDAQKNYKAYLDQVREHLGDILIERIYEMYKDAWEYDQERVLEIFQQLLDEVPRWDDATINEETAIIEQRIRWLRDVLKQLVICGIFTLASVSSDRRRRHPNVDFELPAQSEIVHRFFKAAARCIIPRTNLFLHTDPSSIQNGEEARKRVKKAIATTVTRLIPVELVNQLNEEEDEEDVEEDEADAVLKDLAEGADEEMEGTSDEESSDSGDNDEEKVRHRLREEGKKALQVKVETESEESSDDDDNAKDRYFDSESSGSESESEIGGDEKMRLLKGLEDPVDRRQRGESDEEAPEEVDPLPTKRTVIVSRDGGNDPISSGRKKLTLADLEY